jgi:hypothetical protein
MRESRHLHRNHSWLPFLRNRASDESQFFKRQKRQALSVAAAQEVTNTLARGSITGVLIFAPLVLDVPEEVMVNNVN